MVERVRRVVRQRTPVHDRIDRVYAHVRTVEACAGPGGWLEGARILGGPQLLEQLGTLGIEIAPSWTAPGLC